MRRLLPFITSVSFIACATVTTGTQETLAVTSSPSGADAKLVCEKHSVAGVTPVKFSIRRNVGNCSLTVSKEGFAEHAVTIEQGVNPMYWGNMIFAPVAPAGVYVMLAGQSEETATGIGLLAAAAAIFGTDFITGAVHAHRPKSIDVILISTPRGTLPP